MATEVQVVKIEFNGLLKRFNFPKKDGLSFDALETKIRELFKVNSGQTLRLFYTDEDGDVISMTNSEELKDALVLQGLNPLRVKVESRPHEQASGTPPRNPLERTFEESFRRCDKTVQDVVKEFQNTISTSVKVADSTLRDAKARIGPLVQEGPQNIGKVIDAIKESGLKNLFEREEKQRDSCVPPGPEATNNESQPFQEDFDNSKTDATVHYGVVCDVCNTDPIIGNRYKSTTKSNFDLCEACFAKEGSQNDYIKIEQPPFFRRGFRGGSPACRRNARGFPHFGFPFSPFSGGRGRCHGGFPRSPWQPEGKYDARFVKDVTVFDGTEMPPNTSFTKIWRLRNSGTLTWPRHLQLVHIGGDNLGSVNCFPIELPEQGVSPDEETEISVDLFSPNLPGRYVSHWRLCLPGGIRFGHRFWVLIQVVAPGEQSPQVAESLQKSSQQAPNSTAVPNQPTAPDELMQEAQTGYDPEYPSLLLDGIIASVANAALSVTTASAESVAAAAASLSAANPSLQPSVMASVPPFMYSGVAGAGSAPVPSTGTPMAAGSRAATVEIVNPAPPFTSAVNSSVIASSSPLYPTVFTPLKTSNAEMNEMGSDASKMDSAEKGKLSLEVDENKQPQNPSDSYMVLDDLQYAKEIQKQIENDDEVQRLVGMGFFDETANFEMLKKNDFDMQKAIDDLVKLDSWKSSFADLEEMGFTNKTLNRELMFKHNGVIKFVVKELVDGLGPN